MHSKRNRNHQRTPVWLDTLILWLEFIGLIGTLLAGIYALVTLAAGKYLSMKG